MKTHHIRLGIVLWYYVVVCMPPSREITGCSQTLSKPCQTVKHVWNIHCLGTSDAATSDQGANLSPNRCQWYTGTPSSNHGISWNHGMSNLPSRNPKHPLSDCRDVRPPACPRALQNNSADQGAKVNWLWLALTAARTPKATQPLQKDSSRWRRCHGNPWDTGCPLSTTMVLLCFSIVICCFWLYVLCQVRHDHLLSFVQHQKSNQYDGSRFIWWKMTRTMFKQSKQKNTVKNVRCDEWWQWCYIMTYSAHGRQSVQLLSASISNDIHHTGLPLCEPGEMKISLDFFWF